MSKHKQGPGMPGRDFPLPPRDPLYGQVKLPSAPSITIANQTFTLRLTQTGLATFFTHRGPVTADDTLELDVDWEFGYAAASVFFSWTSTNGLIFTWQTVALPTDTRAATMTRGGRIAPLDTFPGVGPVELILYQ